MAIGGHPGLVGWSILVNRWLAELVMRCRTETFFGRHKTLMNVQRQQHERVVGGRVLACTPKTRRGTMSMAKRSTVSKQPWVRSPRPERPASCWDGPIKGP